MSEIRNLTRNGETFYPLTHVEGLLDNQGNVVGEINDIFDISEYHASGTPPVLAKYASLDLALAAVPEAKRKGGMTIRYVQTSDNKYVQYRLMSDTFSTTESDWQGVDDEPTAGSKNLVTSGGTKTEISAISCLSDIIYRHIKYYNNKYPISYNGKVIISDISTLDIIRIDASAITTLKVVDAQGNAGGSFYGVTIADSSNNVLSNYLHDCDLSSSDLTGADYVYITIRNKNNTSSDVTKIVINGYPFTQSAFLLVLNDYINSLTDNTPVVNSNKFVKSSGIYNNISPLQRINEIFNSFSTYYPNKYPVVGGSSKMVLLDHTSFDVLRIDATILTSLKVSNAPYNTGGSFYGISLVNSENTVTTHYNNSCELSSSDLSGITYVYIAIRKTYSSTSDAIKIAINGYPFTQNAFQDAASTVFNQMLASNTDTEPTADSDKIVKSDALARLTKGLIQNFTVTQNTASGSNNKFKVSNFTPNKKIGFILLCDSGVVNKYALLGNMGTKIVGTGYDYEPNKFYIVDVNNISDTTSTKCGCYISAANAIGTGSAQFICWSGLWQTVDSYLPDYLKPLREKTIWTLWDSLGINSWQTYFAQITGATFKSALNIKRDFPLSVGGTTSFPGSEDGGQARALRLASYKETYPIDYIFYENVNDGNSLTTRKGTIDDKAFMLSQFIRVSPQEFVSEAAAKTWITNNWNTFLGYFTSEQKKAGTIARIPITPSQSNPNGSKITFSGSVSSAGQISFKWMNTTFAISVEVGDTLQDIVDKFLNYNFGSGVYDVDGGNGSLIIFYYLGGYSISDFNGGSTGITATIEPATGAADYCFAFLGDTAAEFDVISNWDDANNITLYSTYKGLIPYLQRTFPEANIYWVFPFSLNPGSENNNPYKDANGNYDMDLYKEYPGYISRVELFALQKEICEYYGVPYIDLFTKSGMGINNITTYIPYNDVHPNSKGYKRYAEYIAKLMGIG